MIRVFTKDNHDRGSKLSRLFKRERKAKRATWDADDRAASVGADVWEAERRGEAPTAEEISTESKAKHAAESAFGAQMVTIWAIFDQLNTEEGE